MKVACKSWPELFFSQETLSGGMWVFLSHTHARKSKENICMHSVRLEALEMFKTSLDVHDTTVVPLERTKGVPLSHSCQTSLKQRAV